MFDTAGVRKKIDAGPVTATTIVVILAGFLLSFVDGFDVIAMSVAATSISKEWGISRAELGPIFSAAIIGMATGAALLTPFADKYGRRIVLIIATVIVGISMIVTGLIPKSVELLIVIRFIAGLGVGVIFASASTIAAEFTPERFRNLAVTIVIMGYPFGAMVVGPIANIVLPSQGWEMLFIYGGVGTLLTTVFIWACMPESVDFLISKPRKKENDLNVVNKILSKLGHEHLKKMPIHEENVSIKAASVKGILSPELKVYTVMLWVVYFMAFLPLYFLLSWIPILFVDSGYDRAEGVVSLTYFNLGAVAGILAIGLITTKMKLAKPIAVFFLAAALFLMVLFFIKPTSLWLLNSLILTIGFLLQGGFTALYALAARQYPTSVRATGVGWAAGLGRVGAVVSPILAGLLSAAGWGMYELFILFSIPLVLAAILLLKFKH